MWNIGEDGDTDRDYREVNLTDCRNFLPGEIYEDEYSVPQMKLVENLSLSRKDSAKFLCPQGLTELPIQGHFQSKKFSYVKISIKGCELE